MTHLIHHHTLLLISDKVIRVDLLAMGRLNSPDKEGQCVYLDMLVSRVRVCLN